MLASADMSSFNRESPQYTIRTYAPFRQFTET